MSCAQGARALTTSFSFLSTYVADSSETSVVTTPVTNASAVWQSRLTGWPSKSVSFNFIEDGIVGGLVQREGIWHILSSTMFDFLSSPHLTGQSSTSPSSYISPSSLALRTVPKPSQTYCTPFLHIEHSGHIGLKHQLLRQSVATSHQFGDDVRGPLVTS